MPDTNLPTSWIRDLPIVGVYSERANRLSIRLPAWLVPVRRCCEVIVSSHAQGIMIRVQHGDVFVQPCPGHNAWQASCINASCIGYGPRANKMTTTRTLDRPWSAVLGQPSTIASLQRAIQSGVRLSYLVRVTPEGIELLVAGEDRLHGLGDHLGPHDKVAIKNALRGHPNHGSPTNYNGMAIRCVTTINHEEEENTMTTIDTTTSNDLPFGLIAGERIVQVEFTDGGKRSYAYFAGGLNLALSDFVVVASPYGSDGVFDEESGGYLKVVRVTSLDATVDGIKKAAKWVIAKVDVADYRARRARVEELRVLDERIIVAKREALKSLELKSLMELSPELAELVAKRLEVSGCAPTIERTASPTGSTSGSTSGS